MKTEQDWLECEDPRQLIQAAFDRRSELWWNGISREPSDRQMNLIICAMASLTPSRNPGYVRRWYEEVEEGEWAGPGLEAGPDHTDGLWQTTMRWASGQMGKPIEFNKISFSNVVRDILGNPFRPSWRDRWTDQDENKWRRKAFVISAPTWLTPRAKAMAQLIYNEFDFEALPVLADLLEEEGCDCEETLNHLRGKEKCHERNTQGYECKDGKLFYINSGLAYCHGCKGTGCVPLRGPHFRGCWALDLLLDKF